MTEPAEEPISPPHAKQSLLAAANAGQFVKLVSDDDALPVFRKRCC